MDKHILGTSEGVCLGTSVECRYVRILRVNVHKDLQVQCDRWMGGSGMQAIPVQRSANLR